MSNGEGITRRDFLGVIGGVAAAAVVGGLRPISAAAQTPEPAIEVGPTQVGKDFDWDVLRNMLTEAPIDNSSVGLKTIAAGWLDQLQESYDPRINRTKELIDLTRQPDQEGNSSMLMQQVEIFLGKVDRSLVSVEQVLPFFQERSDMLNNFNIIKDSIKRMGVKGEGAPSLQNQYFYLQRFIQDTWNSHKEKFGPADTGLEEGKEIPAEPLIVMDPSINRTDEGIKVFEEHRRRIKHFIDTFPYFKGLNSKIVLASRLYGTQFVPNRDGNSGTYLSERDITTNKIIGVVLINMDSLSDINNTSVNLGSPEQTFAHESYGHGLDPLVSRDFTEYLDPKDLIERYTHYFQILNNTDWADHDGSVRDLFRPVLDLSNIIGKNKPITTDEFLRIISQYPRNYILFNAQRQTASIFDDVMGLRPEPSQVFVQQEPAAEEFLGYDQFLDRYLPFLKEQAKGLDTKAVKAQIILYGLSKYKDQFKNTDGLYHYYGTGGNNVVPFADKSTYKTWADYLNIVVLNATLYDGFINGDSYFQGFSREIREQFSRHIIDLRKRARYELFAEGMAWAHVFGDRMEEKPPYRVFMEHAANLLLQRLQRQKVVVPDNVNTSISNHP